MAIDPNLLIPLLPSFAQAVEPDEVDHGITAKTLKPRMKVEIEKFEKLIVTAEVTKSLCEMGFLRRGKKR